MHTNNFCIGVVTFFPNESTIYNLTKLLKSNIDIIIVDNTPNSNKKIFSSLNLKNNFELINNRKNIGLSYAIKQLLDKAVQKGFGSLLYLDQDTLLKVSEISFRKTLIKINNNFYTNNYAVQYLLPFKLTPKYDVIIGPNSGTFFNLKYFKEYDLLPKNFFLEMIDFYLCLYLRKFKLKANYICMESIFDHSNMDSMTFSLVFRKKYYFRIYSFKRLFEIFSKSFFLIKRALYLRDLNFIIVLLNYDIKLFISQLLTLIIFSFGNLPFIRNTKFIRKLKK